MLGKSEPCRVVAVVGPTATGKTATAVALARELDAEIVSADSMAVYVGMDIGTAKPSEQEQREVRFHLIDVADPARPFSVGEYERLAQAAIEEILSRGRCALIVGGSGLYVRAALDGLSEDAPPENAALRRSLLAEARERGREAVHARLAQVDPVSAERIHPNNLKRVIRALEIYEATGLPASVVFERDSERPPRWPNARQFGLTMSRAALYNRIEERVDAMLSSGLLAEARRLVERGLDPSLPSMQGLGYKEIAACIRGECSLDEAVELLKKNTRRFAKRQLTWFRSDSRIRWIDVEGKSAEEVSSLIKGELAR